MAVDFKEYYELRLREAEENCNHWLIELNGLFFNRIVDRDKLNEAFYELNKAVGQRNFLRHECYCIFSDDIEKAMEDKMKAKKTLYLFEHGIGDIKKAMEG